MPEGNNYGMVWDMFLSQVGVTPQKSWMVQTQSKYILLSYIWKHSVMVSVVNLIEGSRITWEMSLWPYPWKTEYTHCGWWCYSLDETLAYANREELSHMHPSPLPACGLDVTSYSLDVPTAMHCTLSYKLKQTPFPISWFWWCILSQQSEKLSHPFHFEWYSLSLKLQLPSQLPQEVCPASCTLLTLRWVIFSTLRNPGT